MAVAAVCRYTDFQVKMPTIKFTDEQYESLLTVLSYLADSEGQDVCEKHDVPGDFDEKSTKEQVKMMRKAEADGHIFFHTCLVYLALDGEEEDDEEEEENDNGKVCQRCGRTTCPSDDHYPSRLLWNSNKTGKEICRCCVSDEDEEEDKKSVHTDDTNLCACCDAPARNYCDEEELWFCDDDLVDKGCGECASCKEHAESCDDCKDWVARGKPLMGHKA